MLARRGLVALLLGIPSLGGSMTVASTPAKPAQEPSPQGKAWAHFRNQYEREKDIRLGALRDAVNGVSLYPHVACLRSASAHAKARMEFRDRLAAEREARGIKAAIWRMFGIENDPFM